MVETLISSIIEKEVKNADTVTCYRKPITGFAEVKNHDFNRIRKIIGHHHINPDDLLPGAQSLVAFFLPFSRNLVSANFKNNYIAKEWAVAYVETNNLIKRICDAVVHNLNEAGIEAAYEEPTCNLDKNNLLSRWSHRSVAKLTGIGSFGLNRLLITDAGCAGRFGSLVVGTKLQLNPVEQKERCRYFYDGSCKLCIERCPVNAIKEDGQFDRKSCYQYLQKAGTYFNDFPSSEVCGKCSVGLPCSLNSAVRTCKNKKPEQDSTSL